MKGKANVKTIIVMVIMVLVVVLGVLGAKTVQTYLSGATEDVMPRNVVATANEDGRGAVISWMSDKESMGVVEYGTSPASLLLRALETSQVTSHQVTLSPLKSGTTYYFRVKIGEEIFDNSGIPYSFKTKESESESERVMEPDVTLEPTMPTQVGSGSSVISGTCNKETDYNSDGTVNALDYIQCIKGSSVAPTSAPAPATSATESSGSTCKPGVDYDNNGSINSLDMIKCLQNQR